MLYLTLLNCFKKVSAWAFVNGAIDKSKKLLFKTVRKLDYKDFTKVIQTPVTFAQYQLILSDVKDCADIYDLEDKLNAATDPMIKSAL